MAETVRVNFNLPVPLFPLPEAILLPQSVAPLHVFEPRYRQMVENTLDHAGQIAMASFADETWREQYDASPELRPVVCLGQIVQHQRVPDGYQIVLHGICRAEIISLIEPAGEVLYRAATLRPLVLSQPEHMDLEVLRAEFHSLLADTDLKRMESVAMVLKCLENQEIDTTTLLEIIAAALVQDADSRYAVLAEASLEARADLVRAELYRLERMLMMASRQRPADGDYRVSVN